jgi:hypothetical protein
MDKPRKSSSKFRKEEDPAAKRVTPKRKRENKTLRLNRLLPKLIGAAARTRGLTHNNIITNWPDLAGDAAGWSAPQSLKFPTGKKIDGNLSVRVASGRGPEMQMMEAEVISRINQLFGYGAVKRITITQTAMTPKSPPEPDASVRKSTPEEKKAFTEARSKINKKADPELQKALDKLGKSLAED